MEIVIVPPFGEYLMALPMILSMTWAILSVSISTQIGLSEYFLTSVKLDEIKSFDSVSKIWSNRLI